MQFHQAQENGTIVKITKVYTKTGDKGQTSLAGQHRVSKTSPRIEALGMLDELNANLGSVVSHLSDIVSLQALQDHCTRIQNELFNVGAQLAVLPEDRRSNTPAITAEDITRLEQEIDDINKDLPALTSFILPGGTNLSASVHISRAVCRRAEIAVLKLSESEEIDEVIMGYINRLSDWLFVVARFCQLKQGKKEMFWDYLKTS